MIKVKIEIPDLLPDTKVILPTEPIYIFKNFDWNLPPIGIATVSLENGEYFANIVGEINVGGEMKKDTNSFQIRALSFDGSSKPAETK